MALNLCAIRKAAGLSQQALADKANVSRVTISRIETGTSKPSYDTIRQLSVVLGIPTDEIMKGAPQ